MNIFDQVTVVIPSYKPDEKLLSTLESVLSVGFTDILVVDDGGGEIYAPIFEKVKQIPACTVLHHPVNKGKGAALKTAFTYYLENRPNSYGVVTADADGQHLASDILNVSKAMLEDRAVVLGCRDFSDPAVPPRSKSGNRISRFLFRAMLGRSISDTQTGLRAIPREYLDEIRKLPGDRYEYETQMLFLIAREKIPMSERTIQTVYIDNNASSHFRAIRDSARIYALPLRFLLCTFLAAVIDVLAIIYLFDALAPLLPLYTAPLLVLASARILSGSVHYLLNTKKVFTHHRATLRSYGRFAVFSSVQFLIQAATVYAVLLPYILQFSRMSPMVPLSNIIGFPGISDPFTILFIRIVVGILLFFPSFRIQHNHVFINKKGDRK